MKKNQIKILFLWVVLLFSVSMPSLLIAQEKTYRVSGVVKDEKGDPIIGGNVKLKDTKIGTITDFNGHYTLTYTSPNDEIQFSYIGYETITETLQQRSILNIILKPSTELLTEVLVVAYGHQKKVSVTGAISSVSGSDLLKVPTASIGNMLTGMLSGISSVQSSGQPGGDNPDIYVRGISTFTGSSAPLMLVDGVERNFFNMDPNEIESVNVLKDASSTAVFGVRGANGVILVTTKRGAVSKAKISSSASFGVQAPTRMLEKINSYEWASLHNQTMINDGNADKIVFTPEALEAFRTHSNPIVYPDVNWTDMLFNKYAPQSQANINISGGTESVRYFTSVGFLHQDGMFKNFNLDYNGNFYYNRTNYRANLDINMTKTSLLTLNVGGVLEMKNSPNVNGGDMSQLFRYIYWGTPISGAGIVDGKWIQSNPSIIGKYVGADGLSGYYGRGASQRTDNTLNIDLAFEQKLDFITKGLKFNVKGSYNTGNSLSKNMGSSVNSYTPYLLSGLTWYTPNPKIESTDPNSIILVRNGVAGNRFYWEGSGMSRNWYAESSINYQRDFGKHHTSALILYNQSKSYYPSIYTEIPTGYVGLVSRVTYDYNTKYLFEFNVGYNGSENFMSDKRYGLFPAVSAGWVVSQENFMKNIPFINYLKMRASYGIVGNDKIGARFLYLPNPYYAGGGYNFGSGPSRFWSNGYYEGTSGNPDVSWEKSYKKNIGLDFSIFSSKLIANIDIFWEKRNGILAYPQTFPVYTGMPLPAMNLGEVSNKGIEVLFKWNDKIGQINYYANLNVSYAKNNIDFMDEVPSKDAYTLKTGHPVGQPFGLKVRGFYYNGMPNVADQSFQLREGDVVYEDLNGDGKITNEDMTALGYPNYPLLNGGLTLGVKWKGWDVSALIIGATLTSRYLQEVFRMPYGDHYDGPVLRSSYENRWTPETRNTATEPIISFTGVINNYKDSEIWLRDASYARLKNVQISYTFSNSFTKKLGISELRPFANAYNLLTLDKLKRIDPEGPTTDRSAYPLMLVMNVGLNINF